MEVISRATLASFVSWAGEHGWFFLLETNYQNEYRERKYITPEGNVFYIGSDSKGYIQEVRKGLIKDD